MRKSGRYFYKAYGISDAEYWQQRAKGLRFCGVHGWLESEGLYYGKYCKICRSEYMRQWKRNNPEKHRAHKEKSREKDRQRAHDYYHGLSEKERQAVGRRNKLRTYGVTPQWYDEQLARQNGVCAICGEHLPTGKFKKYMHVDHNHETGKARGILCNGCNTGVGWLDKKEWVEKAMNYLRAYA